MVMSHFWEAIVMGSGQDAGVPQVGCSCPRCTAARADAAVRRLAPSLLLRNTGLKQAIILDPSPDIREQLDRYLPPLNLGAVKAIYITHGHVGHYWGLAYLGKEGPDLKGVAVYGTEDIVEMLRRIPAIALMEARGNIRMEVLPCDGSAQGITACKSQPGLVTDGVCAGAIEVDQRLSIEAVPELSIQAIPVLHRGELTRTVGFRVLCGDRTLVYIPDVDRWTPDVISAVTSADIALVDGTFFSASELSGVRSIGEIPHPPIHQALELFADADGSPEPRVYFTHLNHTNPAGLPGPEQDQVLEAGFGIAWDGMTFPLAPLPAK